MGVTLPIGPNAGQPTAGFGFSARQRPLRPAAPVPVPGNLTNPRSPSQIPLNFSNEVVHRQRQERKGKSKSVSRCYTCGKVFTRKSSLNRHLIRHLEVAQGHLTRHSCEFEGCDRSFLRKDARDRHRGHKHGGAGIECPSCSILIRKDGFNAHKSTSRCMANLAGRSTVAHGDARAGPDSSRSINVCQNPSDVTLVTQQLDEGSLAEVWANGNEVIGGDSVLFNEIGWVQSPIVESNDGFASLPEWLDEDLLASLEECDSDLVSESSDEDTSQYPEIEVEYVQTQLVQSNGDLGLLPDTLDTGLLASWEDGDSHLVYPYLDFLRSVGQTTSVIDAFMIAVAYGYSKTGRAIFEGAKSELTRDCQSAGRNQKNWYCCDFHRIASQQYRVIWATLLAPGYVVGQARSRLFHRPSGQTLDLLPNKLELDCQFICEVFKVPFTESMQEGLRGDEEDDPLIRCIKNKSASAVKFLLAVGIPSDWNSNSEGRTPLHVASATGNTDVVRLLLDAGAQVDAVATCGCTAFSQALDNHRDETVNLLIAYRAFLDGDATLDILQTGPSDDQVWLSPLWRSYENTKVLRASEGRLHRCPFEAQLPKILDTKIRTRSNEERVGMSYRVYEPGEYVQKLASRRRFTSN